MGDVFLPVTCGTCGRPGASPCATCIAGLRRSPALSAPPGLDACFALLAYEGAARDLVARLKYRNARSAVAWLAAGMAALVAGRATDVVTWAPTTADRRHRRGFDQAELLARAVARELHLPCRPLLVRAHGPPQTGRSRPERWAGPGLSPSVGAVRRPPARVLVVDDVITTGASVAAAARALRAARVCSVVALAAARTPDPAHRTVAV